MSKLVLFNKPFNVLSQFSNAGSSDCLASYISMKGVYPAGRLDKDSEGLLLLTDDGRLQQAITDPRFKMRKVYWAQVEGQIGDDALSRLRRGVKLKDGPTRPATARSIGEPDIWPRQPPVRQRQHIPTSWIELEISEGRNRQVRRMTAAVGYPTLRLVRSSVGPWTLAGLAPGEFQVIDVTREQFGPLTFAGK